jgi:hypothetical protein
LQRSAIVFHPGVDTAFWYGPAVPPAEYMSRTSQERAERVMLRHSSAGTRTERRAGGEGAGTHAEARAEGRGNVAEEIAAAGAATVCAEGSGDIGAEPVAAGVALRIDALHRKAGQELHFFPPEATSSRRFRNDRWRSRLKRFQAPLGGQDSLRKKRRESPSRKTLRTSNRDGGDCGASKLWCQEKRLQDIVVRLREGVAVDPWLNQQAVFLSGQSRSKRSS